MIFLRIADALSPSLLFPVPVLWWTEINCHCWCKFFPDRKTNTHIQTHQKTLFCGFHTTGKSIYSCDFQPELPLPYLPLIFTFPLHFAPPLHCSSLPSPPALLRAVIGLDRESDVVHIETRIAKGRECFTPVHRNSKTYRTLCLSLRVRSRKRWGLLCSSDWKLKSSKAE